jgi:WD40 repeat protein
MAGIPGVYRPSSVSVQNGGAVAAAVGDRGVAIWNLNAKPALVHRVEPSGISLNGVPNVVRGSASAVFSPDGDLLAWTAAGADLGAGLFVVVWDLERGRERTRLPGEQVVSFSPDGKRITTKTFNSDHTVEVVEMTDLDSGHSERHSAVPWTTPAARAADESAQPPKPPWQAHNGRGLGASIPADRTLALWDTQRTQQIGKIDIGVEPDAATLAFDAQGRRLAVTVSGGLAYVIDVNADSWRTQACNLAARQLTKSERATYLGSIEMPDGCP